MSAKHDKSHATTHGTHASAGGHGAAAHGPTTSTFVTIWLVLAFLTVVEVFVPQVYSAPWNHHTKWMLLTMLAVGKAVLVAAYFMHLKWEKAWLKYIAMMPVYMGLAAVILMVEQAFRDSLS
ncbi:MAG: cytochrome C oxidase subunit IV family protein [Planctomycetota bacterium]